MKFESKAHMAQELLAGKQFSNRNGGIIHFDNSSVYDPFRYDGDKMYGAWSRWMEDIWTEVKPRHVHQDLIDIYKDGQAWQYKEVGQSAWHNIKIAGIWILPTWNETTEYRLHHYNDLIQEFNAGAEIEFFDDYHNKWVSASSPTWDEGTKYRIKAKTETVYEWMVLNVSKKWEICKTLASEEHAKKRFEGLGLTYQKTGRSFEVPA
jgi:hypothetical protein